MDRLDTYIGHLIRRLQQQSTSIFVERMNARNIDLTPLQFAALKGVALNAGIDQARLAEAIACDRATMGGVLDRLEKKHLMERVVSSSDRRARLLYITSEGEALLQEVEPIVENVQGEIIKQLSLEERERLRGLIEKALLK